MSDDDDDDASKSSQQSSSRRHHHRRQQRRRQRRRRRRLLPAFRCRIRKYIAMANAERGSIARKRCRLAISAPRLFCLYERRCVCVCVHTHTQHTHIDTLYMRCLKARSRIMRHDDDTIMPSLSFHFTMDFTVWRCEYIRDVRLDGTRGGGRRERKTHRDRSVPCRHVSAVRGTVFFSAALDSRAQ